MSAPANITAAARAPLMDVVHAQARARYLADATQQPFEYHLCVVYAEHALAVYSQAPCALQQIQAWAHGTFGAPTVGRAVQRACEELEELHLTAPDYDLAEIADVIICLLAAPGAVEAVRAKMEINRARKWRLRGDGTGYHVRQESAAE